METNTIIEINSVLNDKQNAEIRQTLQNGCHIFRIIYCMKMLIKLIQTLTVFSNKHVLFQL